jgi:hypothetical protein
MHGEAQDPVPAAVGGRTFGGTGAVAASALTPNLEWDLTLAIRNGDPVVDARPLRFEQRAQYGRVRIRFPTRTNFGGTTNLVHGTIMVRRFPSYVLYGTADIGSGLRTTIPNYLRMQARAISLKLQLARRTYYVSFDGDGFIELEPA